MSGLCGGPSLQQLLPERQRALCNSNLSMSRLPVELISRIFRLVVESGGTNPRHLPPFVLAHVCREWRAVAREDPLLWTRPDFSRAKLASAMLELSRTSPLVVNLASDHFFTDAGGEGTSTLVTHATPEIVHIHWTERIKDLQIRTRFGRALKETLARFTRPMPLLESLHLSTVRNIPSIRVALIRNEILESGDFPFLQAMVLVKVALPATANCFKNLTSLTISASYDQDRIISVLRHSSLLQHLKLTYMFLREFVASSGAHPPIGSVCLSHLRHLEFDVDIDLLNILFPMLLMPKLSFLRTKGYTHSTSDGDLTRFCTHLSTLLDQSGQSLDSANATMTTSGFYLDSMDCGLEFNGSCHKRGAVAEGDVNTQLKFELTFDSDNIDLDILTDLLQVFTCNSLRTLSVRYNLQRCGSTSREIQHGRFWGVLSTMLSLELLVIKEYPSLGLPSGFFVDATQGDAGQSDSRSALAIRFPSLRSLVFETGPVHPVYSSLQRRISALCSSYRAILEDGDRPPLTIELHQTFIGKRVCVRICGDEVELQENNIPTTELCDLKVSLIDEFMARALPEFDLEPWL